MDKTLLAGAISLSLVTLPVQVLAFTPIVEGKTINNEIVDSGGQIVRNSGVINNGWVYGSTQNGIMTSLAKPIQSPLIILASIMISPIMSVNMV